MLYDLKLPILIGEFSNMHPAILNSKCINCTIDAVGIMTECGKYGN